MSNDQFQILIQILEEIRANGDERGKALDKHINDFENHVKLGEEIYKETSKRLDDLEEFNNDAKVVLKTSQFILKPIGIIILGIIMILLGNGTELVTLLMKGVM